MALMHVAPQSFCFGFQQLAFQYLRVVITFDQENSWIQKPEFLPKPRKIGNQIVQDEVILAGVETGSREKIAAKKYGFGVLYANPREEFFIPIDSSVKIGSEEAREHG